LESQGTTLPLKGQASAAASQTARIDADVMLFVPKRGRAALDARSAGTKLVVSVIAMLAAGLSRVEPLFAPKHEGEAFHARPRDALL
jgi:hypothetical protein